MDGVEGDERFHDMGEWSTLIDRRAGAERLPGVVRLPAGDPGRGRHAHRSISARSSISRSIPAATPLLYADGAFVHVDALKKAAQAA